MKIVISGRAAALDATTKREITQAEELKKLDGVVCTEDTCCAHLGPKFEKIGLAGGQIRLAYVADTNQLRVATDYQAPRQLKPNELQVLVKETTAQWSGGIGESNFWQEVRPGVTLDLSPSFLDRDLRTEQIDDGLKPPRKRVSPLLKAVESGDLEKIKKLLARGEDVNARDKHGRPALHLAIWKNQIAAARLLIEQGADVTARDLTQQTALHVVCAVTATSAELVRALLEKGADVNARDSRGETPLMYAGRSGHFDIVKMLIEHGADVNLREGQTALMHTHHLEVIKYLLEHGADPNIRNEHGMTCYENALFQAGDLPRTDRYERWYPAAELLLATIRRRADEGDAVSQYTLATLHERGVGMPKDEQQAFRGFERSARNGCRLALVRLGLCHQNGTGTPPDPARAMEYCRRAAEAGVPLAMGVIGECFAEGNGVARDAAEAVTWYRRGAEIDPATQARPHEVFDFRNGGGACRAQLGECYEEGQGVARDLHEALKWYRAASALGFHQVEPALKRVEGALQQEAATWRT
jgi:TPR repeat protein